MRDIDPIKYWPRYESEPKKDNLYWLGFIIVVGCSVLTIAGVLAMAWYSQNN